MDQTKEYYIYIPTGKVYETSKNNGISHLLEHLLFSYDQSSPDLAQYLDQRNIYEDAFTADNFTVAMFKDMTESQLSVIRKKVKSLIFNYRASKESLAFAKNVIKEEIAYTNLTPDYLADKILAQTIFKNTPLALSILGNKNSVAKAALSEANAWQKRFYNQNNLIEAVYNLKTDNFRINKKKVTPAPKISIDKNIGHYKVKKDFKGPDLVFWGWVINRPDSEQRLMLNALWHVFTGVGQHKETIFSTDTSYRQEVYCEHYNGFSFIYFQVFTTQPQKVLKQLKAYSRLLHDKKIEKEPFHLAVKQERESLSSTGSDKFLTATEEMISTGKFISPQERLKILSNCNAKKLADFASVITASNHFSAVVK